jgi:hypothetical protein
MTSQVVLYSMLLAVVFFALFATTNAGNEHAENVAQEEKPYYVQAVQRWLGPERIKKLGDHYDNINQFFYNALQGWLFFANSNILFQ